jgi:rhodanese-related sulfurtransferase
LRFVLWMLLLVACASPVAPLAEVPEAGGVRRVSAAALAAYREQGQVPVLIDVRTPDEFASGHVPGSINLPLDQLATRGAELAAYADGPIFLICEKGGRSLAAAQTLARRGLHPVSVDGGMSAWRSGLRETE